MQSILAQIHYIPDSWKGQAHTYKVRTQFSQLFQYKIVSELFILLPPYPLLYFIPISISFFAKIIVFVVQEIFQPLQLSFMEIEWQIIKNKVTG